jgi:hypothetical protein
MYLAETPPDPEINGKPTLILGKKINAGAEHKVYGTNNGRVAKIPWFWNLYSAHKVVVDQSFCRMYFSKYNPDSEVISREEYLTELQVNTRYLILQTIVDNPQEITKQLMDENPEIQEAMQEITGMNRKMMEKEGASIEFLGLRNIGRCLISHALSALGVSETSGNFTPAISNIVEGEIDGKKSVYLIDTSLLQTRGEFFAKIIARFFYPIEKFYMRKFFGLEV